MVDLVGMDIDGVIAKWSEAAAKLLGHDWDQVLAAWDASAASGERIWDLGEVLGITPGEMWRPIDAAGSAFWANLEPFEWMDELYQACSEVAPVVLMSSPSKHPSSHSGKCEWIQRHFGRDFCNYLLGSPKYLMARPGVVLIDDSPANCAAFERPPAGSFAAERPGGHAILFPASNNRLHGVPGCDRVEYVREQLRMLKEA